MLLQLIHVWWDHSDSSLRVGGKGRAPKTSKRAAKPRKKRTSSRFFASLRACGLEVKKVLKGEEGSCMELRKRSTKTSF